MTIKVRHKNKHVKCGKHFSGLSKPNSSGTVSSLRLQSAHKKLLTSIIAIIIAFVAGTIFYKAVNAYADETTTINGITYTISSYYKTASVTGYDLTDSSGFPEDGNVTILSSVTQNDTEYKVTSLGDQCFKDCVLLETITIPTTVTSLSYSCFKNCSALSSVTIPDSVTSFGTASFQNCTNLKNITIPNSITALGDFCFNGCTSLTNIIIPDSITSIGSYCFHDCSSLTSIALPNNITALENRCFDGCASLTSISIPDSVTTIGDFCFYDCKSLAYVNVPNNIKSLGQWAFANCSSLLNLTLPNGLISLGERCFYNCSSLTNITIPDSVTAMGGACFYGCSKLESVQLSKNITALPGSGTSFVYGFFEDCTSLNNVIIPDKVTSLGENCFQKCSSLTNMIIPDNVTGVGGACFHNCNKLENIQLSKNMTNLSSNFFRNCTSLKTITIPKGITNLNEMCFSNCSSLKEIIFESDTLTSCATNAFGSNPSGRKYILEKTIPEALSSISSITDSNSYFRVKFFDDENNLLKNDDVLKPASGSTSEATPPLIRFNAQNNPFTGWSSDDYKKVSNTGMSIVAQFDTSQVVKLATQDGIVYKVDEANKTASAFYYTEDLQKDTSIPTTIADDTSTEYTVVALDEELFNNCTTLETLSIPASVELSATPLKNCSSLKRVTFESSTTSPSKTTTLADSFFEGCTSLEEINLPVSITTIGNALFKDCTSLKTVTSLGNITSLPDETFSGCTALSNFIIPRTITSLGKKSFYNCAALENITIPSTANTLSDYCFYNCNTLKEIVFEKNDALTCGDFAFYTDSSERKYIFESTIPQCFENSSEVTSINSYYRVKFIDDTGKVLKNDDVLKPASGTTSEAIPPNAKYNAQGYAFNNWNSDAYKKVSNTGMTITAQYGTTIVTIIKDGIIYYLDHNTNTAIADAYTSDLPKTLEIASNITYEAKEYKVVGMQEELFNGCSTLENLTIPSSVEISGTPLKNCSSLQTVVFNNNPTTLADSFFEGCSSLEDVNLPQSVISIGKNLFTGCKSLKTVTSPGNVTAISDSAFMGLSSLEQINLPDTVTSLGNSSFSDCSSLASITIPKNVASISYHCFYNCGSLKEVIFAGDEMQYCDTYAFYDFRSTSPAQKYIFEKSIPSTFSNALIRSAGIYYRVKFLTDTGEVLQQNDILKTDCLYTELTAPAEVPASKITGRAFCGWDSNNYKSVTNSGMTIVAQYDPISLTDERISIAAIQAQTYTGSQLKPTVDITFKKDDSAQAVKLNEGVAYIISEYGENINVATGGSIKISGTGSFNGERIVTFKINPVDISTVASATAENQTYTGLDITPLPQVTSTATEKEFTKDFDYSLEYANNINAGTASVIIKGINNYVGQILANFTIEPASIRKNASVEEICNQIYDGTEKEPNPVITNDWTSTKLVKDIDYTLDYLNNINPGTATVTIVGINNWKDSIAINFEIEPVKDIATCTTIDSIADQIYTSSFNTPEPMITDNETGAVLTNGFDYILDYTNNFNAGTATAIVQGINKYTGKTSIDFQINPVELFSSWGETCFTYNGKPQVPSVKLYGVIGTDSVEVTVEGEQTNVGSYTAYASISGNDNYVLPEYDHTRFFTIDSALISNVTIQEIPDQIYDGNYKEVDPVIISNFTGTQLVKDVDYVLNYYENIYVGTATVAVTGIGNWIGENTATFEIIAPPEPTPTPSGEASWTRLAGGTALSTMQKIVNAGWGTSDYAIVATSQGYQDALSASALAGLLENAPVLLTKSNELSSQTSKLITGKSVKNVIIVGGTGAVSEGVAKAIEQLGCTVERIAGGTATTTATAVYKWGTDASKTGGTVWGKDAIVATLDSFQDALSIAPYAYAKHAPIFLTDKGTKDIRSSVQKYISEGGFDRTLIVGGTGAVSESIEGKVANPNRLYGGTAYTTSKAIANFALAEDMTATNMGVACGTTYQDALVGASFLGKFGSIIALADDKNSTTVNSVVAKNKNSLDKCYIFGGTAAVSQTVEDKLNAAVK